MRPALLCLLVAACDVDLADESQTALLLPAGEALGGRVHMLAPDAEHVVRVDPVARTWDAVPVSRDPTVMVRPPGSDAIYVLSPRRGLLTRVGGDGATAEFDLGAPISRIEWAPDGRRGLGLVDDTSPVSELGSLNPNAVALIEDDGSTVAVRTYTLSYRPLSVVFDAASAHALVSSTARLHVLDFESLEEHAVPFSAQDGVLRAPRLVAPSPDGTRALVAVSGLSDLFVVSLEPVLIENVLATASLATDIRFAADSRTAVIVNGSNSALSIDLDDYAESTLSLLGRPNRVQAYGPLDAPMALLYRDDGSDRYLSRISLAGGAPDEAETWQLEAGIRRADVEPGGDAAVLFHNENSLSLFAFDARAPSRILLDSPASDLLFLPPGAGDGTEAPHVFVALNATSRLVRYDLFTYDQVVLDTYPRPLSMGRLPAQDGEPERIFVVHEHDLGLISFVEAAATVEPPGGFPAVSGMAGQAVLDRR